MANSAFKWRDQITIPNILTLVRLLMVPVMAYFIYHIDRFPYFALGLFLLIWATDLLDGFIARRFNQISDFGKLFDPAVDKIFQLTTAIMLYKVERMPLWVPIFIFVKELLMALGALLLLKQKYVVSSSILGKLATFAWVICFAVMLVLPQELIYLAQFIFILPAVLALGAFLYYLSTYLRKTRERE